MHLCVDRPGESQEAMDGKKDSSTLCAHTCVSFDFGFASRTEHEPKACGLFIHDRHSGAMHVVPTPQKGGRHLQYLCTEFCTFLVLLGQSTIVLRFDQEPSTLSLLEAEKDMQSTWYQNH